MEKSGAPVQWVVALFLYQIIIVINHIDSLLSSFMQDFVVLINFFSQKNWAQFPPPKHVCWVRVRADTRPLGSALAGLRPNRRRVPGRHNRRHSGTPVQSRPEPSPAGQGGCGPPVRGPGACAMICRRAARSPGRPGAPPALLVHVKD